jgi:hypothetical protein
VNGLHARRPGVAGLWLAAVLAAAPVHAQSVDKHVYAPPDCEFSTTFPMVPEVQMHRAPTGQQAQQAASPGDRLPIMVAQCTTGGDGSAPPEVDDRLARARFTIESGRGHVTATSTPQDGRGDWAIATGETAIDGQVLVTTVATVAGTTSMLVLSVIRAKGSDPAVTDRFIASVVRRPAAATP